MSATWVRMTTAGGSEEGSTGEIDRGLDGLDGGAMPPVITDPGDQVIDEDVAWHLPISVTDQDGDVVRVWATGLPPGARWDERSRPTTAGTVWSARSRSRSPTRSCR